VTEPLIALAKTGEMYSREYVRRKVDAVARREATASAYLENVKECLKPIIEHAAANKIRLGIEGRRGYEEIPSERELPTLLDEFNSPQVGYWHDIGHIQIKENLGFINHEEWLRAIGPRTLGCHVQDCVWPAQDHQPPFAGDVAIKELRHRLALDPDLSAFRRRGGKLILKVWREHLLHQAGPTQEAGPYGRPRRTIRSASTHDADGQALRSCSSAETLCRAFRARKHRRQRSRSLEARTICEASGGAF
jgi:hypothetical protein